MCRRWRANSLPNYRMSHRHWGKFYALNYLEQVLLGLSFEVLVEDCKRGRISYRGGILRRVVIR